MAFLGESVCDSRQYESYRKGSSRYDLDMNLDMNIPPCLSGDLGETASEIAG